MTKKPLTKSSFLAIYMLFFIYIPLLGQSPVTLPRVSPHATITQTIGISTIKIDYHRPAVQGRKIWGDLVPYGFSNLGFGGGNPAPWRAGANENTTITFSDNALVEGNEVEAGTYGLHMIPSETDWTIIFSNQTTGWGSYFYDENEDYLRFNVKPVEAPFTEWLMYGFANITPKSTVAYLQWENIRIPFKIEFDVQKIVVDNFEKELIGAAGFNWQAFNQAATYTVNNNSYLEKGLAWANKAVAMNRSMATLSTKSRITAALGGSAEAEQIMDEALEIASEVELNQFGYQLMSTGKMEDAGKIFMLNVQKHPDSWNVYDSLGEYYKNLGNVEKSKENYEQAKELAPQNQKERIVQIISNL